MVLVSAAFKHGEAIPTRCAGKGVGDNLSPPLAWSEVPPEAVELVLMIEDPSAPLPRPFVHAVVTALPPTLAAIPEGRLSACEPEAESARWVLGRNSFGKAEYGGPRPISGHGPHTYVFQIFALAQQLPRGRESLNKREVVAAMTGLVLARGRLDGVYER